MTILVLTKSPQPPSCHKDALAQDLVRTAVMALSPYLVLAQSCISPVLQISGPCKGFGQDRVRRTQCKLQEGLVLWCPWLCHHEVQSPVASDMAVGSDDDWDRVEDATLHTLSVEEV